MAAVAQTFRDLGYLRLAAIAGGAAIIIALLTILGLQNSGGDMAPLYTHLDIKDSAEVVAELERMGVPFQLQGDGSLILVPAADVLRLRMSLAQEGLPATGSVIGYEIFDRSDTLGTSSFVMNVNMLRALEGELSRTIGAIRGIDSARVHLVMPKRELFERNRQQPTASVAISMRGSNELSSEQIKSILHLVATAVPDLKPEHITLVDNKGKLLARGGESDETSAFASNSEEYRQNYENRLIRQIEELLALSIGDGKVKAKVTADIDFDRVVTNSETFDPEGQVARSVQETTETEQVSDKEGSSTVGVANNLPDADAQGGSSASNRAVERTDATTNYEISKVVENHIKESGKVNRLSVAVLVDGTYAENEDGEMAYAPRSEEELAKLADLVKSAIGFDTARGDAVEVVNMQFDHLQPVAADDGAFAWLKDDLNSIIQTLVLGGVAILAILLIVRPLVARALEATKPETELEEAERLALSGPMPGETSHPQLTDQSFVVEDDPEEDLINIERISGRVKSGTYRRIGDMIESNPDEALNVIRNWIAKDSQ